MRYFFVFVCLWGVFSLNAQDVSSSPYFSINNKANLDQFPLKSSDADITISGPIANVVIKQLYTNTGTKPIDGIYIFPASTRAAVYAMEMKIGERVIEAKINAKNKARAQYEKARSEGKRTSLLEQHKPNVFQMSVANIQPGESVEVTLRYTEFLVSQDQNYSFHYPMIVGPRFSGESESKGFTQAPFLKRGHESPTRFSLSAQINSPVPVHYVQSPSHTLDIAFRSREDIRIDVRDAATTLAQKDFILDFGVNDEAISSGVITGRRNDEQFFLCQIEAPELSCEPDISPREFIFIVDVSGSMRGFPLDVSKQLLRNLLHNLSTKDRFNVLFFSGGSNMLSERSLEATAENLEYALSVIDGQLGGGGTRMLSAIKNAMKYPKDANYSRSFVVITDGYVTVEEAAMTYIKENLDEANFYAFGIGSSVNRYLIEAIAHIGRSEAYVVQNKKESHAIAEQFLTYIQYPVLTDIQILSEGIEVYDVIPEKIPDLTAGRPIYFFGKYKGDGQGKLVVSGNQAGKKFTQQVSINRRSNLMSAIPYLWAREKIKYLDDFNASSVSQERIKRITQLGLDYNLLTKYTSFIAIDEKPVVNAQQSTPVYQATPLPAGVSNAAIGFSLELPEMVSDGTILVKYDIDVQSEDDVLTILFDMILAEKMEYLESIEWATLHGKILKCTLSQSGIHTETVYSPAIKKWLEYAHDELIKMGWDLTTEYEINLSITKINCHE